jgi:hypothetical protein
MSKYVRPDYVRRIFNLFTGLGKAGNFILKDTGMNDQMFLKETDRWMQSYLTTRALYSVDLNTLPFVPIFLLDRTPLHKYVQYQEVYIGNNYCWRIGETIHQHSGKLSSETLNILHRKDNQFRRSGIGFMPPLLARANCNMSEIEPLFGDKDGMENYLLEQIDDLTKFGVKINFVMMLRPQRGIYQDIAPLLTMSDRYRMYQRTFKVGTVAMTSGMLVDVDRQKVLAAVCLDSKYRDYYLLKQYESRSVPYPNHIFKIVYDESFLNEDRIYAKELFKIWRQAVVESLPELRTETINGGELYGLIFKDRLNAPFISQGPLEQIEENTEIFDAFATAKNNVFNPNPNPISGVVITN